MFWEPQDPLVLEGRVYSKPWPLLACKPQGKMVRMAFTQNIALTDTMTYYGCSQTHPRRPVLWNLHSQELATWKGAVKNSMKELWVGLPQKEATELGFGCKPRRHMLGASPFCLQGVSVFITWKESMDLQRTLFPSHRRSCVVIKQNQSAGMVLGKYVMMWDGREDPKVLSCL